MPPAIAAVVLLAVNFLLLLSVTLLGRSSAYGDCIVCGEEAETVVGGENFCDACARGNPKEVS